MLHYLFASTEWWGLTVEQQAYGYDTEVCRQYLEPSRPLNMTRDSEFCRLYLERGWALNVQQKHSPSFLEGMRAYIRIVGFYS